MALHKVSIIWVNYNSSKIIQIALESLESIINLNYPREKYELIVVDNGSTDKSYEKIKSFLEKHSDVKWKTIKLEHNLGFNGGNNVGFRARDKDSLYLLLLNNDAVLFPDALDKMIDYAESHSNVAGVQGVILKYKSNIIDSAGDFINEILYPYALGMNKPYPWIIRKPMYITYADGSCSLYRIDYITKCLGNRLFIDEFFGYADDNVLGLMLWGCNYKLVSIPEVVASHARGMTFGKKKGSLAFYLGERNRIALSMITNTRYRRVILAHALRNLSVSMLRDKLGYESKMLSRAIIDGLSLGEKLRFRGVHIDIYKAPIIRISPKVIPLFFMSKRVVERYYEKWIQQNLNNLYVGE